MTTIEPFFVVDESEGTFKNKHFHRKMKSAIAKREWQDLQHAVDAKALASGSQGACYAVSDGPCSWVVLEFSDKTTVQIFYDSSNPPVPVAVLLHQVQAIRVNRGRPRMSVILDAAVARDTLAAPDKPGPPTDSAKLIQVRIGRNN